MQLKDLKGNPENPRTITNKKKAMLKKSLAEFGDLSGIVYNRRTKSLVGGHQRKDVFSPDSEITIVKKFSKPTRVGTVAEGFITVDGEKFAYREVHWDEIKEKAANIAANNGAGEWDMDQLSGWMSSLETFGMDLDLTMFDDEERSELFPDLISVSEHSRKGPTGTDEDEVPDDVPAQTKFGDSYLLGTHRLLCGDSTDTKQVARLMGKWNADICFTSPPYNLGTNAKLRGHNASGKATVYANDTDAKTQSDYLEFLKSWSQLALDHSKYLFCNIQMLADNKIALTEYAYFFKYHLVDVMVWDKEHGAPAMAPNVLNSAWEFIYILSEELNPKRSIKSGPEFRGTLPNIFRLNPRGHKDELAKNHGAVFPVAFAEHFILNFTNTSALDLFGGSGTTMIACEKHNRKCFMMEMDPHYCDVIVARWEKYTGKKAKRAPRP